MDLVAEISLTRAALVADPSPEVQQTCAWSLCDLALLRCCHHHDTLSTPLLVRKSACTLEWYLSIPVVSLVLGKQVVQAVLAAAAAR